MSLRLSLAPGIAIIIHTHQAVFLQSSNISIVQQEITTVTNTANTADPQRPEVQCFTWYTDMKIVTNTKLSTKLSGLNISSNWK